MLTAQDFSDGNSIRTEVYATFYPEDEGIVPKWMINTEPLEMSALDIQSFGIPRKLPLLKEILQKLYDTSDADYFIYTNADIALMPHFYVLVKDLIDAGNDAFCINKRIIDEKFKDESLSVMWSTMGDRHAGHDCFVFRRELFPLMSLGDIITGTPWSETTLIANLIMFAKNFFVFQNAHATFHLGDRRIWLPHTYNDYRIHNTNEFARILKILSKRNKKILKHHTIKYLLEKLVNEVVNYKDETYSKDCWYFVNKK